MNNTYLVTGANGHLGYNLVKEMGKKNYLVKAGIRNLDYKPIFNDLKCIPVYTDLLDKKSLINTLSNTDILFQCAAVFKHWAKNSEKEIVEANLKMTENIFDCAYETGLKKMIYVSSIAALDWTSIPLNEKTWNKEFTNPYRKAKTLSEQLAWDLAKKYKIDLITVLPAAIIGPGCINHFTPTMKFLHSIINNQIQTNVNFSFNYIYVKDVIKGILAASKIGKFGKRYILGNEKFITTTEIFKIAHECYPNINIPPQILLEQLKAFAQNQENVSKQNNIAPVINLNDIKSYYNADFTIDLSASKTDLNFNPLNAKEALKLTLKQLKN